MSRYENYENCYASWSKDTDSLQFVALVNLILAMIKILQEHCIDSRVMPGWQEFTRAEHLLRHATWLGRGNMLTIQCLIVKCSYLLYGEKRNAAYDAVGSAVRLCFQNGLHNQSSWHNYSPFDITMRQRVFWSVYCLERNIALVCGAPYLIHESDFRVDLPLCLDDRRLSIQKPFPEETPQHSSIPYLHLTTKWCKLCSEVWDAMFGMNAQKPISPEFIAIMDARILLLIGQIPDYLRWTLDIFNSVERRQQLPYYVIRQGLILHLVSSICLYIHLLAILGVRS